MLDSENAVQFNFDEVSQEVFSIYHKISGEHLDMSEEIVAPTEVDEDE